jgi:hypothetical protein
MEQRDWYYLLPDGINTADNMKEAREQMERQTGNFVSSWTFRDLVRKGVIKKLNRVNYSKLSQGYAEEKTLQTCQFTNGGR